MSDNILELVCKVLGHDWADLRWQSIFKDTICNRCGHIYYNDTKPIDGE